LSFPSWLFVRVVVYRLPIAVVIGVVYIPCPVVVPIAAVVRVVIYSLPIAAVEICRVVVPITAVVLSTILSR
jgi:hypothetical protein